MVITPGVKPNGTHFEPQHVSVRAGRLVLNDDRRSEPFGVAKTEPWTMDTSAFRILRVVFSLFLDSLVFFGLFLVFVKREPNPPRPAVDTTTRITARNRPLFLTSR